MKHLMTWAAGVVLFLSTSPSFAQSGNNMMNGEWWGGTWMGGDGGYWMAIAMIAAVGLVVWAILQNKK